MFMHSLQNSLSMMLIILCECGQDNKTKKKKKNPKTQNLGKNKMEFEKNGFRRACLQRRHCVDVGDIQPFTVRMLAEGVTNGKLFCRNLYDEFL